MGKFKVTLDFGGDHICYGYGRNKKDAKTACAKMGVYIVAPVAYQSRFGDEKPIDSEKVTK